MLSSLVKGDIEYAPGRSTAISCSPLAYVFLMGCSFLSTVTPAQFPTFSQGRCTSWSFLSWGFLSRQFSWLFLLIFNPFGYKIHTGFLLAAAIFDASPCAFLSYIINKQAALALDCSSPPRPWRARAHQQRKNRHTGGFSLYFMPLAQARSAPLAGAGWGYFWAPAASSGARHTPLPRSACGLLSFRSRALLCHDR